MLMLVKLHFRRRRQICRTTLPIPFQIGTTHWGASYRGRAKLCEKLDGPLVLLESAAAASHVPQTDCRFSGAAALLNNHHRTPPPPHHHLKTTPNDTWLVPTHSLFLLPLRGRRRRRRR